MTSPRTHELGTHELGEGDLTARRVLADALGMLGQSLGRIAGVALIFFALPAVMTAAVEVFLEGNPEHGAIPLAVVLLTLAIAVLLRTFGPIAFSGFLDEGVAQEYLTGRHRRLGEVLRSLPWRYLIVADIIVTFAVSFGLSLFVVPGLVLYGLFGLIGPILVRERAGLRSSFKRTARLSRSAPRMIFLLVVIPFAVETVLHEAILEAVLHDATLTVQVIAEWLVAIFLGGTLA